MAIDQVTQDQASGVMGPSDSVLVTKTNEIIAQVNANEAAVATMTNPMLFKGAVAVAADFPDPGDVQNGWVYEVQADVVDNDPTKTNTGQEFEAGDEIAWNGADWTKLGPTGAIYEMAATPYAVADGVDAVLVDTTGIGGPSVVNLPSAANRTGRVISVLDHTQGAGANQIAVTPDGAETIDGVAAAFTIASNNEGAAFISDGVGWLSLSSARLVKSNRAHALGDGSDHANVALNDAHRTGDGTDHSAVQSLVEGVMALTTVNFGMSPYPAAPADVILDVDTTGGVVQVDLPAVATVPPGKVYVIKDAMGNAGVAAINVVPNGGETIDGAGGPAAIVVAWDKLVIHATPAGWMTF